MAEVAVSLLPPDPPLQRPPAQSVGKDLGGRKSQFSAISALPEQTALQQVAGPSRSWLQTECPPSLHALGAGESGCITCVELARPPPSAPQCPATQTLPKQRLQNVLDIPIDSVNFS
ncbi:hypothetical protein WJX84_007608 [Apatococcus fuscideae]|uniref:Uncharacterized protein n=1 Tax=Apatococcus fuscideae TaxID=2026836 RepID=A0AAW1SSH2_9CHLO